MPSIIKDWLTQKLLARDASRPRAKVPYKPQYRAPAKPAAEPYHAVAIKPGQQSCEAARQFGQHRFLSNKAPRLPLPGCEATECTCRYTHFADRRTGLDRRAVLDVERQRQLGFPNRRRRGGRRAGDALT
jgi:hypothetical protein